MFSSFFLPCSLFDILTLQSENTNFHPDRAPYRDFDHRDPGGNASACAEQCQREVKTNLLPEQYDGTGQGRHVLLR